jgi:hypothetical protein
MATFDWSRFNVRIYLDAPVDKLYWGWATRAGIEHWFLRFSEYRNPDGSVKGKDEYVKKGDTYKWMWHGYGDDTFEEGKVLEANGKDFFKFSFGKAGNCAVTIKEENGLTLVELVQDEIPTDEKSMQYYHVGCKSGWTFHFTNMKSIYEGGPDLRNKDVDRKDVINS